MGKSTPKKVLIAIPIHEEKLYCFEEFTQSLLNLDFTDIKPTILFLEVTECPSEYLIQRIIDFENILYSKYNHKDLEVYFYSTPPQILPAKKTPRAMKTFAKNHLCDFIFDEDLIFSQNELILFHDSDILTPPETLTTLTNYDYDISSILVKGNYTQSSFLLFEQIEYLKFRSFTELEIIRNPLRVLKVDAMSTSLLLVKNEVLRSFMPLPFQYIENYTFGSHDIIFCMSANLKGFNVMCNITLEALHMQPKSLYEKMKKDGVLNKWLEKEK